MLDSQDTTNPTHFNGKDALGHVIEAQARGIISASEIHGTEMPGHLSAAADASRESALALLLIWTFLSHLHVSQETILISLSIFGGGWLAWKAGRSSWLAWARLERLHRIVGQEKYEIEHHRQQERDELRVLYAAKGFEGKLLEDVLDVLMADGDRLLRVMVEEELGLTLEVHEHPLKQGMGAAMGTLVAIGCCGLGMYFSASYGMIFASLILIALSAAAAAHQEQNRWIPAVIWNTAIGVSAFGFVYFMMDFIFPRG